MTRCEETLNRMTLYLDDELEAAECSVIQVHLNDCDSCRQLFQSERRFLDRIRQSRPLQSTPPELRARVEELLGDASPPPPAPPELRHRIQYLLGRGSTNSVAFESPIARLALVVAMLAVSSIGFSGTSKPDHESTPTSHTAAQGR